MTDFIWVPSKIQSIILLLIRLLPVKKKISIFPFSLNGTREVIPELQKIVLSTYFIIISMHAKNIIISCQILEEVQ